jgi:hypothetical protein
MSSNTDIIFDKFFQQRTRPLVGRFPNFLRAVVVETNDPLSMGRVRFRCPELHDFDMPVEDCPWAVPSFDLGGEKAARFVAPTIGDWIFIAFEKGHPYAPIWVGFANPTRRRLYAYPQVFNITPISFNENGQRRGKIIDYDPDYLPKDGRPMGHGWVDRYGNMDLHSSVGYFPVEHQQKPPQPDVDAVTGSRFNQKNQPPEVNNPDKKYMARVTKYGHIFIMGDQGYHWQRKEFGSFDDELGEFTGDFAKDEQFEYRRWLFVQKLLNDNNPGSKNAFGDQRKILMQTRYGNRIEMRDAGWAQLAPISSKSRPNEFGPARILSRETENDFRWIKMRTKGGMLFQMYDKGTHPSKDKLIKRSLLEDSGPYSEQEFKHWGGQKDARFIRIITRYGIKLVLDDRGADETNASNREDPRGNGFMIKGRRTPAAKTRKAVGNPRGFLIEFNENDKANHMTFASPMGQTIEINDRYQYIIMAASLGKGFVRKFRGIKENEFSRKPAMIRTPERTSHHLKIDHDNEYIRLKTRGGRGVRPETPSNNSNVNPSNGEIQQGLEIRDGVKGLGPWVEVVDCQRRGLWFSKRYRLGIWRAKSGRRMYQWMDEGQQKIVIHNNESAGTIEIYANRSVNVISNQDVNIRADRHIFLRADRNIYMQAGNLRWTMTRGGIIQSNARLNTSLVVASIVPLPSPGGESVERIRPTELPEQIEPVEDRGKNYNGPFEECPIEEVEHKIRD